MEKTMKFIFLVAMLFVFSCNSEKAVLLEETKQAQLAEENFILAYKQLMNSATYSNSRPSNFETVEERKKLREKAYEQRKIALQKAKEFGDLSNDIENLSFSEVYDSIENEILTEDVKEYFSKNKNRRNTAKIAIEKINLAQQDLLKHYPNLEGMQWNDIYDFIAHKKNNLN